MDFMASIVGSLLIEAGGFLCGSVYSNINNTVRLKSNVNTLMEKMENLIDQRNNLNQELEFADRDGKIPTQQVRGWLQKVEKAVFEVDSMQEGVIANNKNLCGCLQRYRLGKKVGKMLKNVEQLQKDGSFPAGMVIANHEACAVKHIPGPSIENQTTASQNLAQVMKLLDEDEVRRIGVWGMGGVGKTTLVKSLNNKLRKTASTQPFGMVIWATVSKDLDLKRVQRQIADRLNMEVRSEESVEGLAIRLHQRLEKEKSFLLILDDVWEAIDLDHLGVPQLENHKGSKIIFTSRSFEVCRGMKTDIEVKVNKLNDKEAWELFSQNAGEVVSLKNIKPLAEAVTKECSGLPLAIITMGRAMRGKEMGRLWTHALNELQRSVPCIKGIENIVYQPLKWSYDTLEGNHIRSCFLYCALFPEDFSIEVSELVECWTAEGLIDEQQSYDGLLNRGMTILESLKDSCLLEVGSRKGTVKMHDVVRDVAIWITSSLEEGCKSLIQSGIGLSEISESELLDSLKRVSFMNNKIRSLPSCVKPCSQASTLLLQGNLPLQTVPETFLQGFQGLRVLNLSGTRIPSLPHSLLQLTGIRSLLLRECYYLEELPPLGGLSRLRVLDLCATRIRELPKGMEQLSHLRQVNLSRTHCLKTIQAGVISRLTRLEVLDMTLSDYHWGVKEQSFLRELTSINRGNAEQRKEEQATFEELISLEHLLVLSVRLNCIPSIGSDVLTWIGRLRRFQLFIGQQANSLPTRYDKRRVTISGLDLAEESIDWLLSNAKSLVLNRCWGLNQMLETLIIQSSNCFAGLKSLTVSNSNSSLRPAGGCAAHDDMLPNLEELYLDRLSYLESISELVGHLGLFFSRLRLIRVAQCPRLKNLLSFGSFILALQNLEEIHVSFCEKLEELFSYCSEQNLAQEPVFTSLRIVELKNLSKLKSPCRQEESWPHVEQVVVIRCNLLRKLPLTSENANSIKQIRGELPWWNQLVWQDANTKSSLQPYFMPDEGAGNGLNIFTR